MAIHSYPKKPPETLFLRKVLAVLPSGFPWPVMECTLQEKVQVQRQKRTCLFASHLRLQAERQNESIAKTT